MQEELEQEIQVHSNSLEAALKLLWEKARLASSLILSLQEDKKVLQRRIGDLENEITQLRNDALVRKIEIDQLREEISKSADGSLVIAREEKERLQQRIQELIGKINSHL